VEGKWREVKSVIILLKTLINLWLRWVSIAVHRLSLVVARRRLTAVASFVEEHMGFSSHSLQHLSLWHSGSLVVVSWLQ
jgi:hypothetical protein